MVLDVLERSGRVWLVPEGSVPEPLRSRAQPCRPEEFHHLLAFARCVVSEGASTAAEAAVLGTPSLYVNPVGRSYIDRLAAYGLVRHIVPEDDVRTTIADLLARAADGAACRAAAERVIADHENVSEFIVRFVEDR
jgi:uncharacterized protein